MATTSTNQEAPNNLLSDSTLKILDLLCEGPISGFAQKNPALPMDPLMSIYFDDVPIRNVDGSYNYNISGAGFAYDYMLGSGQQSGIAGFQKVEVAVPLQSNTLISNPAQGQGPYKTVVTTINTDTYPDADSIRITLRVPALYAQDSNGNTNGYELSFAVDISYNNGPYVPQNPVTGATSSGDSVTTFNGKCTTAYLRTVSYVLPKSSPPAAKGTWRVRVRRTSQDIQSIRTQNAIFVDSISVVSTNGYAYPNSAMSAISIASNQFSSIPTRSYDLLGTLVKVPNGYTPTRYSYENREYHFVGNAVTTSKLLGVNPDSPLEVVGIDNYMVATGTFVQPGSVVTSVQRTSPVIVGLSKEPTANGFIDVFVKSTEITPTITPASYPTIWTGDFRSGVWTDNPAWVFYDLITDPVHGLGDYISASSVDKWSLYQIAQYCDEMVDDGAGGLEPRFTCNVAIQQPDQAYSVLLNLASTFRSMMYYANGTIQLSQTTDDKSPVYEFTNANVMNGAFSYADTAKDTRSTVAMVKWRDPNNGFRESIQYIEDVEGIQRYGYVQKDVSAFACTSPGQAYRLGTWMLQTERLLTETVTFQTSLEGLYLRPGDNFAVYDNFRNNKSQGGRIVGFSTGRSFVDLDRPVTLSPGITYTLTAITPKAVFDPQTITGSDQIDLIRQSQIETYAVIDTPGSYTRLGMAGQFDSGIYVGSPWVLSASGYTGVFDSASFYTCLATSEIEPGKIEVLGLQSNTGIQFLVSTGYTIVDEPPNGGDSNPIDPPTSMVFTYQTGALADNTFYQNLKVSWTDSPDLGGILSQYFVSGRAYADSTTDEYVTTNNNTSWGVSPGTYEFNVAAVSIGGERSSYLNGSYTVPNTNPFGRSPPLSGVFITEDFDDYLFAANGAYTGFVGTTPTLGWNFQQNGNGDALPAYDLITGYSLRASGFDGTTNYLTSPIIIEGRDNATYTFSENFMRTSMVGGQRRGFQLFVDTMDDYGGIATGGMIKMNNPPPKAPLASGFVGFNGGFQYSFTPQPTDTDISGVYLWYDSSPTFSPQFGNHNYTTPNLTDIVINNVYQINDYYMWFALTDTFGYTGCNIYGPVAINPNGNFTGAYFNINQQLTLLAGGYSGLSGYTTGQIYQMNTIVATASGILAQQINSVSASMTSLSGYTNGQITEVRQVIVATGQASVLYSNTLSASLSGYTNGQIATTQSIIANTGALNIAYTTNIVGALSGQSNAQYNSNVALVLATGQASVTYSNSLNATLSGYTQANINNIYTTIVNSGTASAAYTSTLLAGTTGFNSSVQIGARAYVTGSTNGIGGAAVASWGFSLDANGKVLGMRATSDSATQYGVIAFSGASLQSESFSPGVRGWRIDPSGNAEFGNASIRGAFTGGAEPAITSVDSNGVILGTINAQRIYLNPGNQSIIGRRPDTSASYSLESTTNDSTANSYGQFTLSSGGSSNIIMRADRRGQLYMNGTINMYGDIGSINCDILDVDTTSNFDGAATFNSTVSALSFNTTSSARFKENIQPIHDAMGYLYGLRGVTFDWKNGSAKNDIGFIAEEVNEVFPTLVYWNASGQIQGLDYSRLTSVSIEAIKEIDKRLKKVEEHWDLDMTE